ncbi:MBL fold metallo-hydrolase [Gemmatimonadetes bacterium T265]|nr:MBL fold metallo-hydrolase [Gemmatimonadetes bacterium T265]
MAAPAAVRLTTVGTGTVPPSATRVNPGHLVEAGPVRLLMDCGSGVVHRLATLGIDWGGITHLAVTHFDQDHTSDIAALFVAWRYGQLPPRSAPVTVLGPSGTRGLFERLAAALWSSLLAPGFPVEVVELAPGAAHALADGVVLSTRDVRHEPESLAYAVEHAGRRVVYTGDTAPDPTLGAWARGAAGCDVLLTECSLPASMAVPSHLTPESVAELAAAADPGLLVLAHLYPPVEALDLPALVGARWRGPVVVAYDGWSVELPGRYESPERR